MQKNVSTSSDGYPYIKARTVKGKRWHIEFYVWHSDRNQLIRRRWEKDMNRINDENTRMAWCRKKCSEINKALSEGYIMTNAGHLIEKREIVTLAKAVEYAIENKRKVNRIKSYQAYRRAGQLFFAFLEVKSKKGILPQDISRSDIFFSVIGLSRPVVYLPTL